MRVERRCLPVWVVCLLLAGLSVHGAEANQNAIAGRTMDTEGCLVGYRAWVPANVKQLRGVIVGSMGANWDYRHFVNRSLWRAAARHWQFALVGTNNRKKAALKKGPAATAEDLLKGLSQIAAESGHPELNNAAVCSFGFSRGAGYSMALAQALPDRVVAIGCGGSNPRWGFTNEAAKAVCSVPILLTQGDEDNLAGKDWFTEFPKVRAMGHRAALAGQWGLSHFEGNYENLVMLHFDAAIEERLAAAWDPGKSPPKLREIPLDNGWLGKLAGCEKWGTKWVEIKPANEIGAGERTDYCWFVNEMIARAWQAYALRQNAVMIRKPFCDSVDYIASRELPSPHPASEPMQLEAISHWFGGTTGVVFFAGAERIAQGKRKAGETSKTWVGVWENPEPGVHAIYAVFYKKGFRCPTKPCPMVVTATEKRKP